ncbi:proline--tRNA ligase, partial [Candidatus Bathyarchaeota archaeon]|nr:proline--tRNA ligase [Candidatus Bathyarchaeota archaeon]
MSDTGITVSKNDNFSEWYVEVVQKSGLADYAPIKGCIIFREQSYAIWEKIQELFNKKIKSSGHKNVYFPMFIPESFLKKEAKH